MDLATAQRGRSNHAPSEYALLEKTSLPTKHIASSKITHFIITIMSSVAIRRTAAAFAPYLTRPRLRISNECATRYARLFSNSASRSISVAEMSDKDLSSLKVKQDRLMSDIHSTCEWGKGERWGE